MLQKTKKGVKLTAFISGLLIISIVLAVFIINPNADSLPTKTLYGDGTLKAGRYYNNGDKNSFYYEVFKDQTIQLGGIDPLEFVLSFNKDFIKHDPKDPLYEDFWNAVEADAEEHGARRSYVVLQCNLLNAAYFYIFFNAKTVEEVTENGGGFCYTYIDEKTFEVSPYTFIYAGE
jgi:hypothetical protein